MRKGYTDGLFLDNSIFLDDSQKRAGTVLTGFLQLLVILVASWSTLYILIESIPVPAHILYIHLTIALCSAFVFALCLIPSYNGVKLFFCLLFYVLFFISRFKMIENGFYIFENEVIFRLEQYYNVSIGIFEANYETHIADSTVLLVMIFIPIISLITIAVVKGRFVKIASIIILLPVAASFILGKTPSEKFFIPCLASLLYMIRQGFYGSHHVDLRQRSILLKINTWAGAWLSFIGILLFFLLKILVPEDSYYEISQIADMRETIQTKINNITLEDITSSVANYNLPDFNSSKGGLDGGALGRTGRIQYTGSEHLRVIADYDAIEDGIYLKGYVGSEYTGDRWTGHSAYETSMFKEIAKEMQDDFNPINQTINLINAGLKTSVIGDTKLYQMKVEYIHANKRFIYSPYFTNYSELKNINYKQDLYSTPSKQKSSYTFEYYDLMDMSRQFDGGGNLKLIYNSVPYDNDYIDFEVLYRRFVQSVYTRIPEEGLNKLKKLCIDALRNESLKNTEDKILFVKDYLKTNTSYTLAPGNVPEGKDYVEYFLFENKKGYCSHYASAAVLMLRALGVPARYVEGYTVSAADIAINRTGDITILMDDNAQGRDVQISIKDYNAHAWAEVYINGVGWIPVDFTPPAGIGYNAYEREVLNQNTATVSPTRTVSPTAPAQERVQEDLSEIHNTDISPTISKKPDKSTEETGGGVQGKKGVPLLMTLLVFSVLLLFLAILHLKRIIRISKANRNYKAIHIFIKLEKVLNFICGRRGSKRIQLEDNYDYLKYCFDFIDFKELDSFINTVRKARYGRGRITVKELKFVEGFYKNVFGLINNELPFFKKAILKLIILFD